MQDKEVLIDAARQCERAARLLRTVASHLPPISEAHEIDLERRLAPKLSEALALIHAAEARVK